MMGPIEVVAQLDNSYKLKLDEQRVLAAVVVVVVIIGVVAVDAGAAAVTADEDECEGRKSSVDSITRKIGRAHV